LFSEILPGISEFLKNDLAKERLSPLSEKTRLFYVERIDVLLGSNAAKNREKSLIIVDTIARMHCYATVYNCITHFLLAVYRILESIHFTFLKSHIVLISCFKHTYVGDKVLVHCRNVQKIKFYDETLLLKQWVIDKFGCSKWSSLNLWVKIYNKRDNGIYPATKVN